MSNTSGNFSQFPGPLGPKCDSPPNMYFNPNDPTQYNLPNSVGDFWLNTTNQNSWQCVSLAGNAQMQRQLATWIRINNPNETGTNVESFVTDIGGPVVPTTSGAVTVTSNTTVFAKTDGSTSNTLKVVPGIDPLIANNGKIFIGGASGGQWTTLTAGTNIVIGLDDGAITINAAGGGGGSGAILLHTGAGDADINVGDSSFTIAGTANQILTSGSGSTVTLSISPTFVFPGTVTIPSLANPTFTGTTTYVGPYATNICTQVGTTTNDNAFHVVATIPVALGTQVTLNNIFAQAWYTDLSDGGGSSYLYLPAIELSFSIANIGGTLYHSTWPIATPPAYDIGLGSYISNTLPFDVRLGTSGTDIIIQVQAFTGKATKWAINYCYQTF